MSHGVGHKLKLAKHKLMNKVNKDEVEVDDEYEREQERFLQHVSDALRVRDEIHGYATAMLSMGTACEGLGDAVAMFYRSSKPDKIPRAGEVFQNVQAKIGQKTQQIMESEFQGAVLEEWTEYCGFLHALKMKISERNQKLEQYDYYKKKVAKLKENVNSKDMNKLPQNEQKLEGAKIAFEEINAELKEVFALVCDDADNAFHTQLHKMVLALTDLHQRLSFLSGELKVLGSSPDEYGCPIVEPKYKPLLDHYGTAPLQNKRGGVKPKGPQSSLEGPPSAPLVPVPPNHSDEESEVSESKNAPAPRPSNGGGQPAPKSTGGGIPGFDDDFSPTAPPPAKGNRVRALFAFQTDNSDELAFEEGDELTVLEKSEEGWWRAEKDGKQGMIPHNYVEPI